MGRRKGRATTDIVGQAPINFPTGSVLDFAGSTAPDGWLLCFGQAVSRTDYAALFAALGTTYGVGDGSTTFNLPDCRGRVKAGKDNMGGVAAGQLTSALSGVNGAALGSTGGAQVHSIQTSEVGQHNHSASSAGAGSHNHQGGLRHNTSTTAVWEYSYVADTATGTNALGGYSLEPSGSTTKREITDTELNHTHTISVSNNAASSPHQNTQPTIIFNTIIKV